MSTGMARAAALLVGVAAAATMVTCRDRAPGECKAVREPGVYELEYRFEQEFGGVITSELLVVERTGRLTLRECETLECGERCDSGEPETFDALAMAEQADLIGIPVSGEPACQNNVITTFVIRKFLADGTFDEKTLQCQQIGAAMDDPTYGDAAGAVLEAIATVLDRLRSG